MSFSLTNFKFLRGSIVGVIFLTEVCMLHAAEMRGVPIQIVPPKGDTIGTNVNQLRTPVSEKFEADFSKLGTPFNPGSSLGGMMAPPPSPPMPRVAVPSQREKEMLDRRRNWAFATPEESGLTAEEILHLKEYTPDNEDKPPTTAMQRYMERLNNPGSTTNRFAKQDFPTPWGETNSQAGDFGNDNERSSLSPFSATPESSVFKSAALPTTFSDVFGLNRGKTEEDALREQQTYEAHIESFKQVWDFQTPAAPTVATVQSPVEDNFSAGSSPTSPTRVFQSVVEPINSSANMSPALSSPTPVQTTPTPVRIAPPRPDYSMPQRRF